MANNNKQPLRSDGTHPSQRMIRQSPQNNNPALQPFGKYPDRYVPNSAGGYSLDSESQKWHDENK